MTLTMVCDIARFNILSNGSLWLKLLPFLNMFNVRNCRFSLPFYVVIHKKVTKDSILTKFFLMSNHFLRYSMTLNETP